MSEEEQIEVTEVAAPAPELDLVGSLKQVLRSSMICDGLRRGLHESVKALDRRIGKLCVLSKTCDNDEYSRLIKALCAEGSCPLIFADDGKILGEWVGLAKLTTEGTVRKAVRCSVAVITDFGEENPALTYLLEYVKSQS